MIKAQSLQMVKEMKRTITAVLILFLSLNIFIPVPVAEAAASLTASSIILFEPATDRIIYSRAPHKKRAPASTTKIVTALVVLDSLSLNQWVTISPEAGDVERSKLYLEGGDRLRVRDLLKAILMKSANDAARAVAIEISGTERAFGELMTQKAKSLGAKNTRFMNASGLPAEGQYSTAYDLALIMREAMKNEIIVSILKQKSTYIETYNGKRYFIKSHNKMLWRRERMIGKTGWTRNAKYCFVGLIQQGTQQAIVSVLGSRKLWLDLSTLAHRIIGTTMNQNILSYGAKGEKVKQLQMALKSAGFFDCPVTGYFGRKTKRAVSEFQRSRGILTDGAVGPQTKAAFSPPL